MTRSAPVLHAARAEIAAGRLWKARDRLQGAVAAGAAQDVLALLGSVHADMGDLPAAGAAWFLTSYAAPTDPRRQEALDALAERSGGRPEQLARMLPVTAPLGDYPADVQSRLVDLEAWLPSRASRPSPSPAKRSIRRTFADVGLILMVVTFLATLITGASTIIYGIAGLIG